VIDFRYHLVSIIAVFFALAVGIVLGAGPLGERVDEDLPEQLNSMRERNEDLQNQLLAFSSAQEYQQEFIDSVAGELVGEQLSGQDVLVVTLPDADGEIIGTVRDMIDRADANVTGTIAVENLWTDVESDAALDALAAELVSSGTVLPEDADGYERGAAVFASAVTTSVTSADLANGSANGLGDELLDPAIRSVDETALAGFEEAGFVSVEGELNGKATLAVVVAGDPGGDDMTRRAEIMAALAAALDDSSRGTVATGTPASAGAEGVLGAIRADGEISEAVSTVDSAELTTGRIAVVYALVEQNDGGVGQYGLNGDEPIPPIPPRPDNADDDDAATTGDDNDDDDDEDDS
jgi:hypothetical protein